MDFYQTLCPFCFESMISTDSCPYCGHRVGEPIQGIQQLPVGWILDGKYRIGMTLGQGGFGITYLAYDMNLQQKVAIKEYFPGGLVTRSAQTVMPFTQSGQALYLKGVDAFYREARLLAQFSSHPNIVHIQNFFRENNTAYFVMEYVKGKSLAAYLDERGGRLSLEETIGLLDPIMDALDVLHQAGILHRDIAPDNIYLTENGTVKLLDFGAAKNELSQHTHSSAAILKPGYAPLEQYSVTGNQGPWTDVYAMGAVIYRCLTGMMPPDAPDRVTGREITPISVSGAKVSKNVETAVLKALALDIPARWQRMSDFKNALSHPAGMVSLPKQETKKSSAPRNHHKKNTKKKSVLPILIPVGIALCAIIGWLSISIIIPNIKYNKAIRSMNSKKYSEAIDIFNDLGYFMDSQQKISECEELIREERFEHVLTLMSSEKAGETAEAFTILEDFTDQNQYEKAIDHETKILMEMDAENAALILNAIPIEDSQLLLDKIGNTDKSKQKSIVAKCNSQILLHYVEIGDTLIYGTYEQDNIIDNGKEPIEWRVLAVENGRALLISEYGLDAIPYNEERAYVTWEICTLRQWLNREFYDSAFTVAEKEQIAMVSLKNPNNGTYGSYGGGDTEDRIFLLSIDEVNTYFSWNNDRMCKTTDYAKANGAFVSRSNGNSSWRLRSPGQYSNKSAYVDTFGLASSVGSDVHDSLNAVRPAFWLNL